MLDKMWHSFSYRFNSFTKSNHSPKSCPCTIFYTKSQKQKNTSQFVDKIISETGIERATSSLLPRMLKSTCGFSDMIEKNQNSINY